MHIIRSLPFVFLSFIIFFPRSYSVLFKQKQQIFVFFENLPLEKWKLSLFDPRLQILCSDLDWHLGMHTFALHEIDMCVAIFECFFGFFRIDAGDVVFQGRGVVYIVNVEDPIDILSDDFKNLLRDWQIRFGFLLKFEDDLFFEDEAGIEQCFIIGW